MATSGISSTTPSAPLPQRPASASPIDSSADVSNFYNYATGTPDPVVDPSRPRSADLSRRPLSLQPRPEYALVSLMAQRPGQMRKLFESLGGPAADMDVEAASEELGAFVAGGGTLAQFGASKDLDPTTLYLLAVQSKVAQRFGKGKASHRLEHEMDELLAEHETEVGAALNTSQAMRTLAGSASDRMWMRSLYVAAITVRSPIGETFESLLQRFGSEGFEQGATTLLRALSDDIAANRSSVSPDRLQGLLLASLVSMRHVLGLINSSKGFLRSQGLATTQPEPARAAASPKRDRDADQHDDGRRDGSRDGRKDGRRDGRKDGQAETPVDVGEAAPAQLPVMSDAYRRKVEAVTVDLVKLLLQLTMSSSAARTVPAFLSNGVGVGAEGPQSTKAHAQFLDLIRNLPGSLWKEAAHKDHLIETLRRLFEADTIRHGMPAAPQAGQAKA